ncbi:MAG: esterase family protein [Candidatus Dormibacteraeota bacterium]|nr:esterase family protein [Candidatus Dormibacteraeota bacterium]
MAALGGRWRRGLAIALPIAAGIGITLILEASPPWRTLVATIQGVGFDPGRTAMITAWIAAGIAAAVTAALSRNLAAGAICGTAFFVGGYEVSWAAQLVASPPSLPGLPEQLVTASLVMNLLTMASASIVLNFVAAATAEALSFLAVRRKAAVPVVSVTRRRHSPWDWGWRGIAMLVLAGSTLAAIRGVDPLIRYGPDFQTFQPVPVRAAPGLHQTVGPAAPTATPEPGRLFYRQFDSQAMHGMRSFGVYLPPGYNYYAGYSYPVLVLLHGDPGSVLDWGHLGIQDLLNAAIARGLVPPLIAVIPDGNGTVSSATQWANRRDGRDQVESSVLELMRLIDRDYRTLADPGQRLIAGLSSGGFGAANLAARHPDQFGIAISLSGYFAALGPVFGGDPAYISANSPFDLVRDRPAARTVDYLLVVGTSDPSFWRAAERFAAELARLRVPHSLRLLPGAHQGRVWITGLLISLEQVKAHVWPAAPSPEHPGGRSGRSPAAAAFVAGQARVLL